jgi:hypothetical protein
MKKLALFTLLGLFLTGCVMNTTTMVPQTEYIIVQPNPQLKQECPQSVNGLNEINADTLTDKQVANLLLDYAGAYQDCRKTVDDIYNDIDNQIKTIQLHSKKKG